MPRIRTIKPEFFTSLTIADLPLTARLTFIGLWTHVDDAGRCVDDPRLIKAALWPLDDRTASDIELDLKVLSEASLITRYMLNRKRYIAVTNWDEHQRINRPTKSKLPAPDEGEPTPPDPVTRDNGDSWSAHAHLSEASPQERKGKERNREGKGNPPTPRDQPGSPAAVETGERPLPDRMTDAFLDRFARGNSYKRRPVRQVIADALANGTASDELWKALEQLGDTSKPVTANTLQFAFSKIRGSWQPSNVIALPGQTGAPLVGTDAKVAGWLALASGDNNQ